MGTGTSKSPTVGVDLNPRVQYAGNLAKQEGQDKFIDAPILVKLEQGTIRYRYQEDNKTDANIKQDNIDRPHEGPERSHKRGYFFHATLNDFSKDAGYDKEQAWKFRYVCKGAASANQKKVYYVFGQGLKNTHDRGIIRGPEPKPQGVGYKWPSGYKVHGHVYFDMRFLPQDKELDEDMEDDLDIPDLTDNTVDVTPKITDLPVSRRDRLEQLMKRLSLRLLKPAVHIHVFHKGKELDPLDVIGDLRTERDGSWSRFKVQLKPK